MYIDNEVSLTTPLTGGPESGRALSHHEAEGDLSEVDITSQHNSVISQTPDSTIGAGSRIPTVKYDLAGKQQPPAAV